MFYCLCFFFKQKTAYEMRISDWSSDVCSSDLVDHRHHARGRQRHPLVGQAVAEVVAHDAHRAHDVVEVHQRLAHAHHHHVGELALFVRHVAQVLRGDPDLADDLGGGKVDRKSTRLNSSH